MPFAFNNDFGGPFNLTNQHVITTKTIYKNGSTSESSVNYHQVVQTCYRGPKSKNIPMVIDAAGKVWRAPSTYRRTIAQFTYHPGRWQRWINGPKISGYERTGVADRQSNLRPFRILPHFNSGSEHVTWDDNLVNQCVTECLVKLGGQKMAIGVELAEAKAAANMFAQRASQFLLAVKAVKRGDLRRLKGILGPGTRGYNARRPARWWLEYQYGWKPLMGSVYDAYKVLSEKLNTALLIEAQRTVIDETTGQYNEPGWRREGASSTRFHKVHLYAKISDEFRRGVNQVGLANPLSPIWEVVPFSFVIDWAIPVGKVIEALTATHGLDFMGGYRSVRAHGTSSATKTPTLGYYEMEPCKVDAEFMSYHRIAYGAFPRPVGYVKSPFSTGHVLNALALVVSMKF